LPSFEAVRRDWTTLGEQDPLWAVYVAPGTRGGQWDVEEFLALGRSDVAEAMAWLDRLGLPTRFGAVLDFGCGAGRLSQALAAHADTVVGVDVSAPMLAVAADLDRTGRCRFVRNDAPDLRLFDDAEFDLVYSELVLQHLPAPVIDGYLGEFMRVLRPGGLAVLQCTVSPLWTAKGAIWRFVPRSLVRLGQRHVLGYPAPMQMTAYPTRRLAAVVRRHGGEVAGHLIRDDQAMHWRTARYVVRRPAK
jgi:SAM-dependent methyltransferase